MRGLLRRRLGFTGLAIADDLEMKALDPWGDLAERAVTSLAAGCDVLPVCSEPEALPELTERLSAPELRALLDVATRCLASFCRPSRAAEEGRWTGVRLGDDGSGLGSSGWRLRLGQSRTAPARVADSPRRLFLSFTRE